ncbi:hypothetical protein ACIREO_05580 [Streptomyces sp. NPDC102441]|uniref:hypothetical protein n=1 Tax=Streptomyces sp. NPDC102441 TaxID=3366176 RepID=UPI003811EB91
MVAVVGGPAHAERGARLDAFDQPGELVEGLIAGSVEHGRGVDLDDRAGLGEVGLQAGLLRLQHCDLPAPLVRLRPSGRRGERRLDTLLPLLPPRGDQ